MTTQPKKPARRIFDEPVSYCTGVPQIIRRFLFADTPFGGAPACGISREAIRTAVTDDMPSSRLLYRCKAASVSESAVKAGTLNPIGDASRFDSIHPRFDYFFCDARPDFL